MRTGETREPGVEMREARLQGLVSMFEDVSADYGRAAMVELMGKMHAAVDSNNRMDGEELAKVLEGKAEISEFKESAMSLLERQGFFERDGDRIIVDPEKLLNEFSLRKHAKNRKIAGKDQFGSSKVDFIANAFADEEVVLASDPDADPKPLFYSPKDKDQALDPEKIAEADFHFGLWEVKQQGVSTDRRLTQPQPGALDDLRVFEASVAAVMYHPDMGAAKRDQRGRLVMKNKDGEYKLFSGKQLADWGLELSTHAGGRLLEDKPLETLSTHAANLFEKGVAQVEDFRSSRGVESVRTPEEARISETGFVRFKGVGYSFGKAYANKRLRIEEMAPGVGAVVELDDRDRGTLIGTFDLFKKDDERLTKTAARRSTATGRAITSRLASKEQTNLQVFDRSEFVGRNEGEGDREYKKRLQALDNFELVTQFDNDLKTNSDLRLRQLPPDLIRNLQRNPDVLRKGLAEAEGLVQEKGEEGLELVALTADIPEIASEVRAILPGLEAGAANTFFKSVVDAARARHQTLESIGHQVRTGKIDEAGARELRFMLGDNLADSIRFFKQQLKTSGLREGGVMEPDIRSLLERVDSSKLFANIFRDAYKGSQKIDFERLRGVELRAKTSETITDTEKKEMEEIFNSNWAKQKPEVLESLSEKFLQKLEAGGEKTKWHILKENGKVAAFGRFDKRSDGSLYAGSFNVGPSLRGSGIGEAMMTTVLNNVAKEHVVHADVFPGPVVGTSYVERFGFVVTGVNEYDGNMVLLIDRDDTQHYELRDKKTEEILEHPDTMRFDVGTADGAEAMIEAVRTMATNGKIGTRYFTDPSNPNIRYMAFESKPEA